MLTIENIKYRNLKIHCTIIHKHHEHFIYIFSSKLLSIFFFIFDHCICFWDSISNTAVFLYVVHNLLLNMIV